MTNLSTPDAEPWNLATHDRKPDPRSSYEVDRDRIIHCETFRDLQYKTQVQGIVAPVVGQGFRTRLNHVIEVAQIARSLAKAVGGNEPLAEAIALAHDLGHPPFGHAGERALGIALLDHGLDGWNANVHSLKVIDYVERTFLSFRGLSLTWATREGVARHSTPFDDPVAFGEFAATPNGGLECQLVDAADVLAYVSHDLDDALEGGYIGLEGLAESFGLLDRLVEDANRSWELAGRQIWPESEKGRLIAKAAVARLFSRLIGDIISNTRAGIIDLGLSGPHEVRAASERIVAPSAEFAQITEELLALLTNCYYRSPQVSGSDELAAATLRGLFEALLSRPQLIPDRFEEAGDALNVATYLASLNDQTAVALAGKLGLG